MTSKAEHRLLMATVADLECFRGIQLKMPPTHTPALIPHCLLFLSRLAILSWIMESLKTQFIKSLREFNWWFILKVGGAVCALLLFFHTLPLSQGVTPLKNWSCQSVFPPRTQSHYENLGHPRHLIPNLVHFVYLVEDPTQPNISFSLRRFIAIYSAHYYLHPETIYIHTNLDQEVIDNVWDTCGDTYVKAVGQVPNIKFNRHIAPNTTSTNKTVDRLPNQSDFIRTDVLRTHGGIYLDDDSYVLRDLRPFRHMGFEMVTGRQSNGQLCPAVMLSTPDNKMITAYHTLQDQIFDGSWAMHATDLLTALVYEFAESEHMSLILPSDTFFPGSWNKDDLEEIYQQHHSSDDYYMSVHHNRPTSNLTDFIENFRLDGELGAGNGGKTQHAWKHDWRLSYVLHGWTSGIGNSFDDEETQELFGKHREPDLDYILSRSSNFARAVYPAVQHALDTGILSIYQDYKVLSESPMNNGTEFKPELSDKEKQLEKAKDKQEGH